MRTIKFKDVLWAVAYKTGQDPQQGDFLTNQAIPVGHSISQWVRRGWPAQDWPEWTLILKFAPNGNHIVPYDYIPPDDVTTEQKIGKTFAVYLVDPNSTLAPVATDHRLTDLGVHVGFDHGTYVWIKFTPPPPTFTAEVWTADRVYGRDEVAYLDRTGECYRSRFNGNTGNEPAPFIVDDTALHGAPPGSEVVQAATPGQRGSLVQPLVYDIYHIVSLDNVETGSSFITVLDSTDAPIASVTYTHVPGDTQISIITALYNALLLEAGLASFTITLDTTNLKIRLSDNSNFQVAGNAGWINDLAQQNLDQTLLVSAFSPAVNNAPPLQQKTEFTFTNDQLVSGAVYRFNIVDPAGVKHTFEYTADDTDSMETVLDALSAAMAVAGATDQYFFNTSVGIDHASLKFTVSTPPSSVEADIILPGQPYWELVPFPEALADSVIRGAVADLNKEWGQTQEGVLEEQAVQGEVGQETSDFTNSPSPLTYQQEPQSRYARR